MEFDTGVKLKPAGRLDLDLPMDFETVCSKVSDVCRGDAKEVGDSGAGEFWLDYSSALQTRHLVVNVESAGQDRYAVKFRVGRRLGRLSDVLLMACLLLAFWCLGKTVSVAPDAGYIVGLALSVIAAGVIFYFGYGKTFGREETARLSEKLRQVGE